MKKLFFALILSLVFALPATVSAQFDPLNPACDTATEDASICNTDGSDPIAGKEGIIMRVVNILSYVVGAASVIMVIFGGMKYVLANGDSNSISTARNTILYALIGVVVFLFSQLIIRFVISRI